MQKYKFSIQITLKTFPKDAKFELIHQGKIIHNLQLIPNIPASFEVYLFIFNNGLSIKLNSTTIPISIFSFNKCPVREFETSQGMFHFSLIPTVKSRLSFSLRGKDLDNKDLMSLSDPYFVMFVGKKEVYRSEVIMDNLNPIWNTFELDDDIIKDKDIVSFHVWDKDPGTDDFIGICEMGRKEILSGNIEKRIHNTKKKGDPKSGTLFLEARYTPSFAERFLNGSNLKATFILPCHFDYSTYPRILNVLTKSMPTENTLFYGYSSAEKFTWSIGSNCSPSEVLNDSFLKRKNLGPSIIGPALNLFFRDSQQDSLTLLFILAFRDLFDPKTISYFLRKSEKEQVLIYFICKSGIALPNLESCQGVKILKFNENIEEDLIKQFNQLNIDLASYI